jgi:hypothetical protein
MLAQPALTISLLGVLFLGTMEGVDTVLGRNVSPVEVEAEIAKREIAAVQAQTIARAAQNSAECVDAVKDLDLAVQALAVVVGQRGDEQLAATGEVAQYLPRLAAKLTKTPPETGPRYDEYVRKSLLRDFRQTGTP